MRVLDLFSGIGGFSLGLERAGMKTVAFCEIEPFCRAVLRKHWPDVPIYEDVRTLTGDTLRADGIVPDVICGGFPCQDISVAGKGAGIEGERSGLWREYARIIGEIRPRYVIVENVAALLGRGLARVLGDLAALGFDAEWHCVPASAVGAPHRRDRLWIVAYARGAERWPLNCTRGTEWPDGYGEWEEDSGGIGASGETTGIVADPTLMFCNGGEYHAGSGSQGCVSVSEPGNGRSASHVSDADSPGFPSSWPQPVGAYWRHAGGVFASTDWWSAEPDVGRVAHGVPARVDRLRSLGNAVVPQIPEIIGKAIIRAAA